MELTLKISLDELFFRVSEAVFDFEQIRMFVREHKREPVDSENSDTTEREYAIRLRSMREQQPLRDVLETFDFQNLLGKTPTPRPLYNDQLKRELLYNVRELKNERQKFADDWSINAEQMITEAMERSKLTTEKTNSYRRLSNEEAARHLKEEGDDMLKRIQDKIKRRSLRAEIELERIQQFVAEYGREPLNSMHTDWSERGYAVNLRVMRENKECRDAVAPLDKHNLLGEAPEQLQEKELRAFISEKVQQDRQVRQEKQVGKRKRISLSL